MSGRRTSSRVFHADRSPEAWRFTKERNGAVGCSGLVRPSFGTLGFPLLPGGKPDLGAHLATFQAYQQRFKLSPRNWKIPGVLVDSSASTTTSGKGGQFDRLRGSRAEHRPGTEVLASRQETRRGGPFFLARGRLRARIWPSENEKPRGPCQRPRRCRGLNEVTSASNHPRQLARAPRRERLPLNATPDTSSTASRV